MDRLSKFTTVALLVAVLSLSLSPAVTYAMGGGTHLPWEDSVELSPRAEQPAGDGAADSSLSGFSHG